MDSTPAAGATAMVMSRNQGGFTLIEMLMVVVVIAIIAGLVLASIGPVRQAAMRSRSQAIVAITVAGLARVASERGGEAAPIEHPLAGSVAPRSGFVRSSGDPVESTGEALHPIGGVTTLPVAWRGRAVLADDRFSGAPQMVLPLLYGAERRACAVIGAANGRDTRIRTIPAPNARYDRDGDGIIESDVLGMLDDERFLTAPVIPVDPVAAGRAALFSVLGSTTVDDLDALAAIRVTPPTGALALSDRVVVQAALPHWLPGTVQPAGDSWRPYALVGTWLVDAWGRELTAASGAAGTAVTSAGRDGVLRWSPGADGMFQTAAHVSDPAGDDRDGTLDNLSSSWERTP